MVIILRWLIPIPVATAVGSVLLFSSTALAQGVSAYKDPSTGAVWIKELPKSSSVEIKDVQLNGKLGTLHLHTNTCGQAEVPQAVSKYRSLTILGTTFTFNISNLPSKPHIRCNPSHPNLEG